MRKRRKQYIRRGIKLIAAVLLLELLCFNMYVLHIQHTYGSEQMGRIPFSILLVTSGSMEPVMSAGDGILVYETPYEDLKTGDIITYQAAGDLVTHEIIRFEDGKPVTRGRANLVEDSPVQKEDYCAKTYFVIPKLAQVLAWSESPVSKGLITAILFVLLFGWDIFSGIYSLLERKNH